ncbi:transglutaminase domain-containing protein [Streptococcus sp. S784/96/1]|uniref:transglutaminase domain-containing protein n=1 Tax=Streptococcus sp. S784/96/1 TaxID=2653499 RepID=UPI001EE3E74C|nr:transglutaminase domain-containing protein [Streptococcus sp. S784/96/1]
MAKKFRTLASVILTTAGLTTVSTVDVKADSSYTGSYAANLLTTIVEDGYPAEETDGLGATHTEPVSHRTVENLAEDYPFYDVSTVYDISSELMSSEWEDPYRDYRNDYNQLEAERKQLVYNYSQWKAISSDRELSQESQQTLTELKAEVDSLQKRASSAIQQYRTEHVENNPHIEHFEVQVQQYHDSLNKIDDRGNFVEQHYVQLSELDQLDDSRHKMIQHWYPSDETYRLINNNLHTTNAKIRVLTEDLITFINQRSYTSNENVAILAQSAEQIKHNINVIEEMNRAATRRYTNSVDYRHRQTRSTRPNTDPKMLTTLENFKNEGYNLKDYRNTDLTAYNQDLADLRGISDLDTLKERTDEAHRLRTKTIKFTLKQSEMGEDLSQRISRFIKENLSNTPNARGISKSFSWWVDGFQGVDEITVTLKPEYYMTDIQHQEYMDHIRQWTRQNINETDTDVTKIDKIQDYIMTNYRYANSGVGSLTPTGISVQTPYAFLKDNEAVCQAYAQLFKDMGQLAGLDVYYIQGFGDPRMGMNSLHAWNIVKVDGAFYHVDLTWNDTIDGTNKNHTYTLRGNDFMKRTHRWNAVYNISNEDYHGYDRSLKMPEASLRHDNDRILEHYRSQDYSYGPRTYYQF